MLGTEASRQQFVMRAPHLSVPKKEFADRVKAVVGSDLMQKLCAVPEFNDVFDDTVGGSLLVIGDAQIVSSSQAGKDARPLSEKELPGVYASTPNEPRSLAVAPVPSSTTDPVYADGQQEPWAAEPKKRKAATTPKTARRAPKKTKKDEAAVHEDNAAAEGGDDMWN